MHPEVPLSEALPPLGDTNQIVEKLSNYPVFDANIRKFPNDIRIEFIKRISSLVHPQNRHIAEYNKITGMLHSGYYARNVYRNGRIHLHNYPIGEKDNYPRTAIEQADYINQQKERMHNTALVRNTALLAHSGMGKTTLIESILHCYPQVIQHSEYRGQPFSFQQLVWLKLECPFNGSHKGLMISLINSIDRITGENYSGTEYKRISAPRLIEKLQQLNRTLRIGFIVIDEIQRLKKVSPRASHTMLEFLVQFSNTVKVPLMFVGTLEAKAILTADLQQTRRIIGEGNFTWDPPTVDSADWRGFMKILFHYQYVRTPVILDEELITMMYRQTQGIADFAVKLFILTQKHLIRAAASDNDERITPEILAMVATQEFREITPHLKQIIMERHSNISFAKKVKEYEQAYRERTSLPDDEQENEPSSVNFSASVPPVPPLPKKGNEEKKSPKKSKRITPKKKTEPPSLRGRDIIHGSSDYLSGSDIPDA